MPVGRQVPFCVEVPDQIRTERYYDPEFYALEAELLWPRVWQMACRLEEIPEPGDFVEYEIIDQSIVVVRQADGEVAAFHNACRHRGVRVASGAGNCSSGLVCPFHGWSYGPDGKNIGIPRRRAFSAHNVAEGEIDLLPVRCDTWGGCAWINLDADAPPLRASLEPVASILDAWQVESLRTEWWRACRLPVNWKLAEEAFVEQYHVLQTHPQLGIPERFPDRDGTLDADTFLAGELLYLHAMSTGMAGMVHANDVAIAERLRSQIQLGGDAAEIMATWHRTFNDAVVAWHRERGAVLPDLNELEDTGRNEPMGYAFPHYFVLPMYSSASSYRFRPLGPEETLMEIWSLTRVHDEDERPRPTPPEVWDHDDPRFPPIPQQDFSNLPRQQRGLHSLSLDFLRLSEQMEGHISNFHRVIDAFLAGQGHDDTLPMLAKVNVNPLEMPVQELP